MEVLVPGEVTSLWEVSSESTDKIIKLPRETLLKFVLVAEDRSWKDGLVLDLGRKNVLAAAACRLVFSSWVNTPSLYDLSQHCIESMSRCNLCVSVLEVKIERKELGTINGSFEKASYAAVISTDKLVMSLAWWSAKVFPWSILFRVSQEAAL
jgi:hypothetical protein